MQPPKPLQSGFERHDSRTAVPDDVRGYALQHFERHVRLEENGEVIVAVDVDEARRERQAVPPSFVLAASRQIRFDGHDAVAAHGHVRDSPRRATPVEDTGAANDQIEWAAIGSHANRMVLGPAQLRESGLL